MTNLNESDLSHISVSKGEYLLMWCLQGKEIYGLKIPDLIHETTGGQQTMGVGTLYPVLRRLETKGLIEGLWDEEVVPERGGARRRYYRLTELGKIRLDYPVTPGLIDQLKSWALNKLGKSHDER